MLITDLSPSELAAIVPPLQSQEGVADPIVYIKFVSDSGWRWYVTEGSLESEDLIFFGFVIGAEEEWGEFSLSELSELYESSGHPIRRDLHLAPGPLSQVLGRENRLIA